MSDFALFFSPCVSAPDRKETKRTLGVLIRRHPFVVGAAVSAPPSMSLFQRKDKERRRRRRSQNIREIAAPLPRPPFLTCAVQDAKKQKREKEGGEMLLRRERRRIFFYFSTPPPPTSLFFPEWTQ